MNTQQEPTLKRDESDSGDGSGIVSCATAFLYWTYRAQLTNDSSLGVNQKMNDSEALGLRLGTTGCATGKLGHLHWNSALPKQQVTRRRQKTLSDMVMLTRKQPVVLKLDLYSSLFFFGRPSPNDSDRTYFAGFV